MRFGAWIFALTLVAACTDGGDDDTEFDGSVDAGQSGDAGEPSIDAGGSDGSIDGGALRPVTIRFQAQVGTDELRCGATYANVGTPSATVTLQDLRFYVQDLRLIDDKGAEVPVVFEERAPFQSPEVALIDFSDGSGECTERSAGANTVITGRVPEGVYTGIAFTNGVPLALNHGNPSTAPAPLKASGVHWGWLDGYRFFMAEFLPAVAADAGLLDAGAASADAGADPDAGEPVTVRASFVHSGSTGCTGTPGSATGIVCAGGTYRPNRAEVRLTNFDPAKDSVVVDLARLFEGTDVQRGVQCHGRGATCTPFYDALGIDSDTGAARPTQTVFRVK